MGAVRELAKSVLLDVELHQYACSKIVAALFMAALEIKVAERKSQQVDLHLCRIVVERLISELFNPEAVRTHLGCRVLPHVEDFGRYIILRQ